MLASLQILTVLDLSVALALSLAHALELPGKRHLAREDYFTVQRIYYPGFTYGGASEPLGIILLAVLLFLLPYAGISFRLTAFALLAMVAMQATYWLVTHRLNRAWVKDIKMSNLGTGFFAFGSRETGESSWQDLRDRWEYSHLLRAILAFASLTAMVISLRVSP